MKMRSVKKVGAFLLAATLATGIFGTSTYAATANAGQYGTMTYTLGKSGNTVSANTRISIPNSSARVITGLEVQNNANGARLFKETNTSSLGASRIGSSTVINNTSIRLAAFSSHEVRGATSTVRYLAEIF